MAKKLVHVVGFRLTDADVKKLDALADQTFRGRGDVVRLLLSMADVRGNPDIILSPIPHVHAEAGVEEVHVS